MCYRETRDWACECTPIVYSRACRRMKSENTEQCPDYEIRSTFRDMPCDNCALLPTPPATPPTRNDKIQEIRKQWESGAMKKKVDDKLEAANSRERRNSIGRLKDKCTECRMWGHACDQKQPRCTNCRQNGTICESTKEWFGRVSGGGSPFNFGRVRSSSISASARASPSMDFESDLFHYSNAQIAGTPFRESPREEASRFGPTDASLQTLQHNMRGLKAAMDLIGAEHEDDEDEQSDLAEAATGIQAPHSLPDFMNFYVDKLQERPGWSGTPTSPEADNIDPNLISQGFGDSTYRLEESIQAVPMIPDLAASPSAIDLASELASGEDRSFGELLEGLGETTKTIKAAAKTAYRKLRSIARSRKATPAFREFVRSLGTLDEILQTGAETYNMLIDGGIPRGLREIYCFLHFAYAMSQADNDFLPESSEREYRNGLLLFRSCLSSAPDYSGSHSQRDIFDEIAQYMAHELECALRWVKKQNLTPNSFQGLSLKDVLRYHSQNADVETRSGQNTGEMVLPNHAQKVNDLEYIHGYFDAIPSVDDITSLTVFTGVTNTLLGLRRFGSPFKLFCGDFCKSLATNAYGELNLDNWHRKQTSADSKELILSLKNRLINTLDYDILADKTVSAMIKTTLQMFDCGSLFTLEDFVEYTRGLMMVVFLPETIFRRLEAGIIDRAQKFIQQLPLHLLDWVQSPSCASALELGNVIMMDFNPLPQELDMSPLDWDSLNMDFNITAFPVSVDNGSMDFGYSSASSYTASTQSPRSPHTPSTDIAGSPNPSTASSANTCATCGKAFTNKSNLVRHEKTKHDGSIGPKKMLKCHIEGCRTVLGSTRAKENMRTHLKKKHGINQPYFEPLNWRGDFGMYA